MDANAWTLVEGESAEEEEGTPHIGQALIGIVDGYGKRMSNVGIGGTSHSGSSPKGAGSDILLEELDELRRSESEHREMSIERMKKRLSRSKSPAIDSLRQFGKLVLDKMKRRRSEPLQSLSRTRELKKPKMRTAEMLGRQQQIVSGQLLHGGERRARTKERCAHLFHPTDESHLADALSGSEAPLRQYVYDPYCPVHGSRRRMRHGKRIQKRLVDMHSFLASVDTTDEDVDEKLNPYLGSQGILAKQFRKERRAILREMEGPKLNKMKRKIGTDLLVISLAFLFLFTGFNGLQTLQTAINGDMGADSLCVLYLCMAISSLFVPPFILKRLGCKRTLVIGIGIHVLYFAANFIPRYYSLIPTSIVAGMAASCVWASKCVYITESAIKYAKLNVESTGVVIPRFFGYFFMFYHMGQVLGNVLSSLILGSAIERLEPEDRVDYTCGHSFLVQNLSERAQRNLSPPPRLAFLAVVGIDLCCAIVACATVKLFLNPLQKQTASGKGMPPSSRDPTKFSTPIFRLTLRNLRRPKSDLLIPLTIFNGIEQAFAVGLYTKAYVGCGLGISEIGFVMTLVFGPLIKLFGRMPLLMFGAVINLLMIITLMIWVVNPGDRTLFNAVAGVWGMADGVWNTQLNGFWVALLGPGRDQLEVAFANYRFWMSFGLALGFFLIRSTSIDTFLLIAFAFLLMGILGYFLVELFEIIAMKLELEERTKEAIKGEEENAAGKEEQQKGKEEQQKGKEEQQKGKEEQQKGKEEQQKGKEEQQKGKEEQQKGKEEQQKGKEEQQKGKEEQQKGMEEQQNGPSGEERRNRLPFLITGGWSQINVLEARLGLK
uniref:Uncharacterized protein n=1 Tax=Globodera rostochiensis TaxID=31243 RepID=A0A914H1Z4_GLORO